MAWAVMFNSSRSCAGKNPASAIDPLVHGAVDAVTEWPDGDAFDELLAQ